MHFPVGNHPSKTFPADQDAFLRPKSSPQNISCQSGCIPLLQNHPCKTFPANQDAFLRPKSSLQNISFESGCISGRKIIPAEASPPIRMHSANEKHLADIFGKSIFSDFVSSRYCYSTKNPYTDILPQKMLVHGFFVVLTS